MAKAIIKKIDKFTHDVDGKQYLDVCLEFTSDDGNQNFGEKRFQFPLEISRQELEDEVRKIVVTFQSDLDLAEKNREVEAVERRADELISNLSGAEISA